MVVMQAEVFVKQCILLVLTIAVVFSFCESCFARVDREIQSKYENKYEGKEFYLREDFLSYQAGKNDVLTDMDSFLYSNTVTNRVLLNRAEKVLIEKIDFDAKKIEIDLKSPVSGVSCTLIFQFNARLSDAFIEEELFQRRFSELFMETKLKRITDETDKISNLISSEIITRGMSKDELFLTLAKPSDIFAVNDGVKHEEFTYFVDGFSYVFVFQDEVLLSWKKKKIVTVEYNS